MGKTYKKRKHFRNSKKVWQLQEAKARFSELVSAVEHGSGCQTITKNGHPVAVIISKEDFDKTLSPKNSLLDFFQESPYPDTDFDVERKDDLGRETDL